MKKKIVLVAVITIVIVSVYVGLNARQKDAMSDIQMVNVEALVQSESSGGDRCYNTVEPKEGCQVIYCPSCRMISGTAPWYASSSSCL